jgi:hypothetical protein
MEQNIYKQAILDAKAIRASAIANAKTSLTEAMEPRIQEMMRLKLSEEMEGDMEEDIEEGFEDNLGYSEGGQKPKHHASHASEEVEESEINELDLDEILAELDGISEEDDTDQMMDEESLNEAEDDEDKPEEKEESEEDETADEEMEDIEDMESEEDVDDETKVIDITLGDLKQVLQSVMGSQTPDVGLEPAGDEDLAADQGDSDSDELSLDDVLAELEKAEGKKIDEKKNPKDDKSDKEKKKVEKELEEAKRVIHTLNETLKDVNLLNAKLLYVNKIFKSKSLTESEKIKVVKAFDRASNVREVKNTYVTLQESFATKKNPIRESIGFASKPAGVAPKTNIVESDPFVNRWKKIAGIK